MFIDTYHLDGVKGDKLTSKINALQLSPRTCEYYLDEASDSGDISTLTSYSVHQGKHILNSLVTIHNKTKQEKFPMNLIDNAASSFDTSSVDMEDASTVVTERPTVTVTDIPPPDSVELAVAKATRTKRTGRPFNPNSKIHQAQRIYDASPDKSRDVIVKKFESELELSYGTATSYFYTSKKSSSV